MNAFNELLEYCKENGITVKYTDSSVLYDFAGMNDKAAKDLGFTSIGKCTILIDRKLSAYQKFTTLKHELLERGYMDAGDTYWKAHVKATKREKKRFIIR
jgi:hypothetical protein